ncbi:MAG: phage major capsid protein [Pseudomonadota bacterium]
MKHDVKLAALMAAHHGAYLSKVALYGQPVCKDGEPTMAEVVENQNKIMQLFEALKSKNDERLDALEKKGSVDILTEDELKRIQDELVALKSVRDELDALAKKASRPGTTEKGELITPEQKEHRDAFVTFMRNPNDEEAKRVLQQIEKKAVSGTSDTAGGHAIPEVIARQVQRELTEAISIRSFVNVITAGSKDYKELVDRRGAAYGWVGEGSARSETGTPGLAEAAPTFGTLYAYPKATEESLADIFFDVGSWLVSSMVEAFLEGEENAIINGDGANKPTGFLNGTPVETTDQVGTRAFGTLQYVRSGAATTLGDGDGFINVVTALKKGYRRNARWMFNKRTSGEVMKIKDGDGNYLWKMGDIVSGQPDRLLGYPIAESEEMPDVAPNAFPMAFGDFRAGYTLVDLVGFRLTRDELTEPGYVKWYARRRMGGVVRKDEAIKLMRCQAAA